MISLTTWTGTECTWIPMGARRVTGPTGMATISADGLLCRALTSPMKTPNNKESKTDSEDTESVVDASCPKSACSAYILLSVRVDNLFTQEQLKSRGIDEYDMVLECFDDIRDLVLNGEELEVEDIDIHWPNATV